MNYTKGLILHHNDMDGRSGGYLLYKYFKSFIHEEDITTMECSYTTVFDWNELADNNTLVGIVDYSLNHQWFAKLIEVVPKENIIWIDHHKTAIEDYKEQSNLAGIRNIDYCGAELVAMYINGFHMKSNGDLVDESGNKTTYENAYTTVPTWIKEVGNFDCWRTHIDMDRSKKLNYGIRMHWDSNMLTTADGRQFWADIDYSNNVEKFIEEGAIIMKYQDSENKDMVAINGFEVKLKKDPFADYKCIAVNTSSRGSDVFKSVFDQYEVGFVFCFSDKKGKPVMNFSVYRLGMNPQKNIDVSRIAQSFGGGGHVGAAGFKTNGALPFK